MCKQIQTDSKAKKEESCKTKEKYLSKNNSLDFVLENQHFSNEFLLFSIIVIRICTENEHFNSEFYLNESKVEMTLDIFVHKINIINTLISNVNKIGHTCNVFICFDFTIHT
jgi:hypothetical protein